MNADSMYHTGFMVFAVVLIIIMENLRVLTISVSILIVLIILYSVLHGGE